jgi:mRNA interferase HigB
LVRGGAQSALAQRRRHQTTYAAASIVTADRVVFNVRGNSHRLVVSADFEKSIVWIKWLGTHREYDRIDVTRVEHEK